MLSVEKEKVVKKAAMVRQMYQHETRLKEQVKELEEKLKSSEEPTGVSELTKMLNLEKEKVVKKATMVRQMYQHETRLKE